MERAQETATPPIVSHFSKNSRARRVQERFGERGREGAQKTQKKKYHGDDDYKNGDGDDYQV